MITAGNIEMQIQKNYTYWVTRYSWLAVTARWTLQTGKVSFYSTNDNSFRYIQICLCTMHLQKDKLKRLTFVNICIYLL